MTKTRNFRILVTEIFIKNAEKIAEFRIPNSAFYFPRFRHNQKNFKNINF